MGDLDNEFMLNMERALDMLPQMKNSLDAVQQLPDDLDEPLNQREVDALIIYTGAIHLRARRFLELADRMMVGGKVQVRLIEKEKEVAEEYEPGVRNMMDETGHTQADF